MNPGYPPPPTKFGPRSAQAKTAARSQVSVFAVRPPPTRFGGVSVQRQSPANSVPARAPIEPLPCKTVTSSDQARKAGSSIGQPTWQAHPHPAGALRNAGGTWSGRPDVSLIGGLSSLSRGRIVQRMHQADIGGGQRIEAPARAAVRQARQVIKYGPGNIEGAIVESHGRAWERASAARNARPRASTRPVRGAQTTITPIAGNEALTAELVIAVGAHIANGGNCAECAAITFFELNKTLNVGTDICLVSLTNPDHAMVLIGKLSNLDAAYVADAWSPRETGPARQSSWYNSLSRGEYKSALPHRADGRDYVGPAVAQVQNVVGIRKAALASARQEIFSSKETKATDQEIGLIKRLVNEAREQDTYHIFGNEHEIPIDW